jgi:RNA polymerase sigma-70 factor, ECF subfamily
MSIVTDRALLDLIQTGDQPALLALYDRYSSLVYAVALRILKHPTSAEDVTQDLFLQIWSRSEQIQVPGRTLHGFMLTASRNRAIDILRKKNPEPLGDLILVCSSDLAKCAERRLVCDKALTMLEGDARAVLEMAFFEEMSHAEIALATGWPLGTIKSRIRRSLNFLRSALVKSSDSPLAG